MKKIYFLLLALGLFTSVNAQIINIPDANFKAKLLEASSTNNIASSQDPVYNVVYQDWVVPSYNKIDINGNGEIEVSEAEQIKYLNIQYNNISNLSGISAFVNLEDLRCSGNQLISLDLNNLPNLVSLLCSENRLTLLNISNLTSLKRVVCTGNQLTTLNINPLATELSQLSCSNNYLNSLNVTPFTNLVSLGCSGNTLFTLNLNGLSNLKVLNCSNTRLSDLNLSNLINLTNLDCSFNNLPLLDFNSLINLKKLVCAGTRRTELNVNNLINLETLYCQSNQLVNLDVSNLTKLKSFTCSVNQLTSLNVSGLTKIVDLDCRNNMLTSLDLNLLTSLDYINCSNNKLESLLIKNSTDITYLDFSNNPTLKYVCVDDGQIAITQNKISTYGYINCNVNTYCTFSPGGVYYTVQGNNKFDSNFNGCSSNDGSLSNLKYRITNGSQTGFIISNDLGNFSSPLLAGTYSITPIFENSNYFSIYPQAVNVNFPTQVSPFTQNFCITRFGSHPDLEITTLPIDAPRPGFDATYKLIYKNKGNTTQSGTVNLVFNNAVLDFVVANPVVTTQTVNNLSWDFTNLVPFETREIAFTLNVNSPMETPAVNNGDVLNYTATITSAATDDMPNDNTFALNQTVVNSYDPNDKTCLEGATISPTKVGDYVHYMIRFENNGTANAQNIVVKDMIDTNKFDVNSLVPIKGSHDFFTRINGSKVEFIFENINLPFDDANNDGYVSFKIKTKPTLTNGDTFSNTASIYFDYNFPIVTNTATTTIAALSRQDFEFSNYFNVYPNPVTTTLNISAKETIEISSINIYNTLGQLVLVIPNAQNIKTVDVSGLASGNYFMKINSDKGTSNTKFIKQ